MKTNWSLLCFPYLCALIGERTSRLSQAMHNAGFLYNKLDFKYVAINTLNTKLAIDAVRELGFRGLSITIPHKEAVMALVDEMSSDAKEIGAINTLINDGKCLHGINTDWHGIIEALNEVKFEARGKKALVYGAGGAARAAIYALKKIELSDIFVTNRNNERANNIAKAFDVFCLEHERLNENYLESVDLFINSTPVGVGAESKFPFDVQIFSKGQTVFDMVTKETVLCQTARLNNASVINGSRMLLYQAARQFELFTETSAPFSIMEDALVKEITNR